MKSANKKCRICKDAPAAHHRLMCNSCRKKRYNEMKGIEVYTKPKIKKEKLEKSEFKKEDCIEQPHKIRRTFIQDDFNNWY